MFTAVKRLSLKMSFFDATLAICEQFLMSYDPYHPPINHPGFYWLTSLYQPAHHFRFTMLGQVTRQDWLETLHKAEEYFTYDLVPLIREAEIILAQLVKSVNGTSDPKIHASLQESIIGQQNYILALNEPRAQIRAVSAILQISNALPLTKL